MALPPAGAGWLAGHRLGVGLAGHRLGVGLAGHRLGVGLGHDRLRAAARSWGMVETGELFT